ncbi:dynein axonemal intermediate chain 3 [Spea bombifrons]|uniref:dynein axonemal intermediate chain 3 n=1 Tax=Spea bombifrons TaxID=233779 RepID=UPI002348EF9B|nr:dynein axonemal intermediate chain 3 [Spea bombifrons]
MSAKEVSRSPSRGSRGSPKRPKSIEKKSGGTKRKGRQSAKKREDSAAASTVGHPDYIAPLVLTSKTQEIFQCRANEDVTQEKPFKLLKKDDVLGDLRARAAVSDFHPLKSVIAEYPGEELLLVFDGEFKYGQNFYLVSTEEAKDLILHPPEAATDEEEKDEDVEEYVPQPLVVRPWVSLGSEVEIEDETLKPARAQIKFVISRVHREFGSQVTFSDSNASEVRDGYMECVSYPDTQLRIAYRERDSGVQAVPVLQDKSTQTKWTYPRNSCTQYEPRTFSEEETESRLSSKAVKEFINSVSVRLEMALQQNEIMNAFWDDWRALCEDESAFGGKSDCHLKEFQSFTEHHFCKNKSVSCVNWHPTVPGLVAVSVTERLSFEDRVNLSSKLVLKPSLILLWSFADPIHPQLMLQSPEDVSCFQFSPSDPNIIVGGCINGQVVVWDISAYEEKLAAKTNAGSSSSPQNPLEPTVSGEPPLVRFCALSSIEHGHRGAVTDIHWLPDHFEVTRTGSPYENRSGFCVQLVTCSTECSVMFWDIRSQKPPGQKIEKNQPEKPQGVPDTFRHLDLVWRPLIKATIPRIAIGGESSPLRISLREEDFHSRTADKLQIPAKEPKIERGVDYGKLRASSAKHAKIRDDINTNYFAGTEDGEVIYTDWKMERDGDTGKLISMKPSQTCVMHDGVVHTVQRSPFLKDIVLTVGGWSFAIWREGVTGGPILQSRCSRRRYTAAHWSPARAGLFFIGREDGNVDIWDLLEKTHEASQTQNVSGAAITSITPWIASAKQHFVALGDDCGTLHILEMPWTLRQPSANEVSTVQNYFDREVKHLEYSERRKKDGTLGKREPHMMPEIPPPVKSAEQSEEEFVREYESYATFEQTVLSALNTEPEPGRV